MIMNNNKKSMVFIFSALLLFFLLLLSYKAVLLFTNTTPAQENVFDFLDGKGGLQAGFTEAEASHLQDVKQVMDYAEYFLYALLFVMIITVIHYRKDKKFLNQLFDYGGKIVVAAMLVIGITSFFFFDFVFTVFHKLFFPQGNWIFAADSLLIQTFPLDFFVSISRNILVLTLFLGILFILLGYYLNHVHGNRN